jgi:hypothetical protein
LDLRLSIAIKRIVMANLYDGIGLINNLQFRLLTVLPGSKVHDPINCELTTHPMSQHPEYEALSYCWGDGTRERLVSCNDQPFKVTENVECALKKLRRPDVPRLLWIDAICINQDDIAERSHQVSLMQDIYRQATRVLVWLGLSYENSDLALQLCERLVSNPRNPLILEACQSTAPEWRILFDGNRRELIRKKLAEYELGDRERREDMDKAGAPSSELEIPKDGKSNGPTQGGELDNVTDEELLALYRLLKRPYWSRCWVIQEFCLASEATLVCGNRSIKSESFFTGLLLALLLSSDGPQGRSSHLLVAGGGVFLMTARHEFRQKPETFGVLEMLWNFRSSLATDPRDKVYALLGLLSDEDRGRFGVLPDYELTTAECYIRAAASLLIHRENLDSLTTDRTSNSHAAMNLPSWVSDWGNSDVGHGGLPLGSRELSNTAEGETYILRPFSASRNCGKYTASLKDPRTLALSGFVTDKLTHITEAIHVPNTEFGSINQRSSTTTQFLKLCKALFVGLGQYFDTLVEWEKLALSEPKYPTGEDPLMVFCETLVASNMPGGKDHTFASFMRWRSLLRGPKKLAHAKAFGLHKLPSLYAPAVALAGMGSARHNMGDRTFLSSTEVTISRRLARTEKGYLALVPELSRTGDYIALFRGGKMPFVIRERGKQWELIGCSYVHGIMSGQAWDEDECQEMEIV